MLAPIVSDCVLTGWGLQQGVLTLIPTDTLLAEGTILWQAQDRSPGWVYSYGGLLAGFERGGGGPRGGRKS
jgi:hypothetical protein